MSEKRDAASQGPPKRPRRNRRPPKQIYQIDESVKLEDDLEVDSDLEEILDSISVDGISLNSDDDASQASEESDFSGPKTKQGYAKDDFVVSDGEAESSDFSCESSEESYLSSEEDEGEGGGTEGEEEEEEEKSEETNKSNK
jgi:hypothetical protein